MITAEASELHQSLQNEKEFFIMEGLVWLKNAKLRSAGVNFSAQYLILS